MPLCVCVCVCAGDTEELSEQTHPFSSFIAPQGHKRGPHRQLSTEMESGCPCDRRWPSVPRVGRSLRAPLSPLCPAGWGGQGSCRPCAFQALLLLGWRPVGRNLVCIGSHTPGLVCCKTQICPEGHLSSRGSHSPTGDSLEGGSHSPTGDSLLR